MTLDADAANLKAMTLLPGLVDDLMTLAAIPSCAFPGQPAEPVLQMANATIELLKKSGAANARLMEIPNSYPAVYAEVPAADPSAPTVLVYAHYDVQPTPADQIWDTDPWTPVIKDDGRIYARGIADDKSGIAIHAGALQIFDGKPPVNLKILIEGEEECGGESLAKFIEANPQVVQADAFIIADAGNIEAGKPALTTGLRGLVSCKVTVRTGDRALHSGMFGGAIPDALVAMIKLLGTLHDEQGNTAIDGLTSFDWPDAEVDEKQLRTDAGLFEEAALVGSGSIASRLWSHPSVTVLGMDVPTTAGAANALISEASAKLSLRIAPGSTPDLEYAALRKHLESHRPWGAELIIERLESGAPFLLSENDSVATIALDAMSDAWVAPAERIGSGGSIPLVAVLQNACPDAGVLIFGAEDQNARIHSSNESLDPSELEHAVVAEALFLDRLAAAKGH